jgi:hypothetical protein
VSPYSEAIDYWRSEQSGYCVQAKSRAGAIAFRQLPSREFTLEPGDAKQRGQALVAADPPETKLEMILACYRTIA